MPTISALVLVMQLLQSSGGNIYRAFSWLSLFLSDLPRYIGFSTLALRQSASGILVTLTVGAAALILGIRKAWFFPTLLGLQMIYLLVLPSLIKDALSPAMVTLVWNLIFGLGCVVVMLKAMDYSRKPTPSRLLTARYPMIASVVALVFLVVAALNQTVSWPSKVLFIENPEHMDTVRKPTKGVYGLSNLGMYGTFLDFLTELGTSVDVATIEEITESDLTGRDLVIFPCPSSCLSQSLKEDFDRYLRLGGHLMVLTDHTNIFGTQTACNDFLQRYGITVNYDSAMPVRSDWVGCFEPTPLLLQTVSPGADPWIQLPYLTGASLSASSGKVILSAKFGFEDLGDPTNGGRNAFLGNYAWDPGRETLGDVVLAVKKDVGHGSVCVVGDTSLFQSLNVSTNKGAASLISAALNRSPNLDLFTLFGSLCLLTLSLGAGTNDGREGMVRTAIAMVLCSTLVLVSSTMAGGLVRRLPEPPKTALVDLSNSSSLAARPWEDDSIYGLAISLRRAGYWPHLVFDDLEKHLANCHLAVLVSPQSLTPAESTVLAKWVDSGGRLLCAVGYQERRSELLEQFGLRVVPIPLGDWPQTATGFDGALRCPEFVEAWPLDTVARDNLVQQPLLRVADGAQWYDLVTQVEVGSGIAVFIGDTRILRDAYLEGEKSWNEQNIEWLLSVLELLK